jgi:uncharacterized protein YcfL
MSVSNMVKMGLVVGAMAVLTGCSSTPETTVNADGKQIVIEPMKEYSKPKQPLLFGKISPEDYKKTLTGNQGNIHVRSYNTKPNPVALDSKASVQLDVVANEDVLKADPTFNAEQVKDSAIAQLKQKGINVVEKDAKYHATMTIIKHGMIDVNFNKTDSSGLSAMLPGVGVGLSDALKATVLLAAGDAASGGTKKTQSTIMELTVVGNNEKWEGRYLYTPATEKINTNMVANVIREQLEPLDPDYAAYLSK